MNLDIKLQSYRKDNSYLKGTKNTLNTENVFLVNLNPLNQQNENVFCLQYIVYNN